jgi:hypothetical protein
MELFNNRQIVYLERLLSINRYDLNRTGTYIVNSESGFSRYRSDTLGTIIPG